MLSALIRAAAAAWAGIREGEPEPQDRLLLRHRASRRRMASAQRPAGDAAEALGGAPFCQVSARVEVERGELHYVLTSEQRTVRR